jgi:hypothetical protein
VKVIFCFLFLLISVSVSAQIDIYHDLEVQGHDGCNYNAATYTIVTFDDNQQGGAFTSLILGTLGKGKGNGFQRTTNGTSLRGGNLTDVVRVHDVQNIMVLSSAIAVSNRGASAEKNDDYFASASCQDVGVGGSDDDCDLGGLDDPVSVVNDGCSSPILIDLGSDGIACGGAENLVSFDLLGIDQPMTLTWVQPHSDDAFLVHDRNGNGIVDDGSELFGNGTRLLGDDVLATNGFVGLAQFDDPKLGGDGDLFITANDQVWQQLGLWLDINADAVCQPEEMISLDAYEFVRFATIPKEREVYDDHGNWYRYWASADAIDNRHIMIDVYFKRYLSDVPISEPGSLGD